MAKVYDLSSYLEEKKSTIKLGDIVLEINDGFNDLLKIDALSGRRADMETSEFVQEFLKVALGEEQAKLLLSKNLSTKVYIKIMNCIQEVYAGEDEEQEGVSKQEEGELV